MYKDKDKQRETDRERQRRYRTKRDKHGVTKGVTNRRCDKQGVTEYPRVSDQEFTRLLATDMGAPIVKVSKPGVADYIPQCETTRAFVEDRPKVEPVSKRGKNIKTFEDLPLDVQQTIDIMSVVEGVIDQTIKANRTAIAIHYQHVFPNRYEPQNAVCTVVVTGKPGDTDYEPQCETTKAFIGKLPSPGEFYHSGAEMGGTDGQA